MSEEWSGVVRFQWVQLNRLKMIKELIKLANHLDSIGLLKEADFLDKIAEEEVVEIVNATDEGELENCWLQFESWPDWIQRAIINRVIQEGLDDT